MIHPRTREDSRIDMQNPVKRSFPSLKTNEGHEAHQPPTLSPDARASLQGALDSLSTSTLVHKTPDEHVVSHALRSQTSGLPPTPPSQDGDHADEPLLSPSMLSDVVFYDAFGSPRLNVSTPIHLTGPPTPDNTPPTTRERLRVPKPDLISYPSQADSFVTARETLRSHSSNQSRTNLSASRGELVTRPSYQFSNFLAPSMLDSTHVPSRLRDQRQHHRDAVDQLNVDLEHKHASEAPEIYRALPRTPTQESSSEKGSPTPRKASIHKNVIPMKANDDISPARKWHHKNNRHEQRVRNESGESLREAPSLDNTGSHDALYTHLRDEKSKRLSAHSTNSIVEAMVYSSPSGPRRELRHAGKNLALRTVADIGGRRVISDSHPGPGHGLKHHREPLPGRAFGAGHLENGESGRRSISTPEALQNGHASGIKHVSKLPALAVAKRTKRLTPPDWPLSCTITGDGLASSTGIHDDRSVGVTTLDNAPSKVLTVPHAKATPSEPVLSNGWRKDSVDEELESPPLHFATDAQTQRPRIDSVQNASDKQDYLKPPIETHDSTGTRRASIDRSTVSPGRRASSELRHERISPWNAHSTHTPLSERSQWSDRTIFAEVNEAKAVNIYPHHNESVLVVQQRGSLSTPADYDLERSKSPSRPQAVAHPRFEAFLDTGTPPSETANVNGADQSPSMLHPRAAPQPPAIKFIPPTPNDELDRQLSLPDSSAEPFSMNATSALPQRRTSLRKRAKAHSTALVDAILFRAPSTASHRRSQRRRHSAAAADGERPKNLHPFWRPRGFWEDFDSDASDSDDDVVDDEERDILPAGGDTSNVDGPEPRQIFPRKMSRRLPGFRGSGGFLVGNSLGLERWGTNKRRPHISLPLSHPLAGRSLVPGQENGAVVGGVRKRRSEHALRTLGASAESLRGRRRRFGGGVPGWKGLREKVRGLGERRLEVRAEKRRQRLRGSIGGPLR